jgi:alpha-mannosidase
VQNVVCPAYELNTPVIVAPGALKAPLAAPVLVDADNVIVEAVKPAEDIENAYVVRLYEAERARTVTQLTFPADVKRVQEANMLEEAFADIALTDGVADVTFKPFEIKTFICYR